MTNSSFVRVFEPADAPELAQAEAALQANGIEYFVENGHYFTVAGGLRSIGDTRVFIQVSGEDAGAARALLNEWFARPESA